MLSALLAAYIPFTHMSHFVGKYFTYHAVRWDDAANRRGGAIEQDHGDVPDLPADLGCAARRRGRHAHVG